MLMEKNEKMKNLLEVSTKLSDEEIKFELKFLLKESKIY